MKQKLLAIIVSSASILSLQAQINPILNGFELLGTNISNLPKSTSDHPQAMAIQKDGKTVVLTYYHNSITRSKIGLTRYNSPGEVDLTFGDSGLVIISKDIPVSVLIQNDGKILVSTLKYDVGNKIVSNLHRFNPDGKSDLTFGEGGALVLSAFNNFILRKTICLKDGSILSCGTASEIPGKPTLAGIIFKISPTGTLDPSFGENGILKADFGHNAWFNNMDVQSDGKIILSGSKVFPGKELDGMEVIITRYTSNGVADKSFKPGERAVLPRTGDQLSELTLLNDGRILLMRQELVAMLNPDGSAHQDFGFKGLVLKPENFKRFTSMALLPGGGIMLSGSIGENLEKTMGILKLLPNGTTDPLFGTNGFLEIKLDMITDPYKISLLPEKKLLVMGQAGFNKIVFGTLKYQEMLVTPTTNIISENKEEDEILARIIEGSVKIPLPEPTELTAVPADEVQFEPQTGSTETTITSPLNLMTVNAYPNPFNENTNLVLDLPFEQSLDIRLFDFSGREIRNLTQQYPLETGKHIIDIEGGTLTTGIYFIRIKGQGKTTTVKIVRQ